MLQRIPYFQRQHRRRAYYFPAFRGACKVILTSTRVTPAGSNVQNPSNNTMRISERNVDFCEISSDSFGSEFSAIESPAITINKIIQQSSHMSWKRCGKGFFKLEHFESNFVRTGLCRVLPGCTIRGRLSPNEQMEILVLSGSFSLKKCVDAGIHRVLPLCMTPGVRVVVPPFSFYSVTNPTDEGGCYLFTILKLSVGSSGRPLKSYKTARPNCNSSGEFEPSDSGNLPPRVTKDFILSLMLFMCFMLICYFFESKIFH